MCLNVIQVKRILLFQQIFFIIEKREAFNGPIANNDGK